MQILDHRSVMLLCGLSLLLATATGCISDLNPRLFSSDFSYGLTIYTNESITNATFYIPLPVKNGVPMVGNRLLNESDFSRGNITASFTTSPPGLNLTGTYFVPNNIPWFVKLTGKEIFPGPKTVLRMDPAYDITITDRNTLSTPLLYANTLTPVGNESIFLPKLDFIPSAPPRREDRASYWLEYDKLEIPGKTFLSADYSSSSSADVRIGSNILGSNQWVQYSDAWIGNEYSDYFHWSHAGEIHGWQTVTGSLYEAGQGIYPNLTHPEWQKAILGYQKGT